MPAKIVLSLIVLALVGGGAALAIGGNVAGIAVGALLVLVGLGFGAVAVKLLRDPQATADRLVARRAELEARSGRAVAAITNAPATGEENTETAATSAPTMPTAATGELAAPEPTNRATRRAAERANRGNGKQRRSPRR